MADVGVVRGLLFSLRAPWRTRHFVRHPSEDSLARLLRLVDAHGKPFPIGVADIREALFSLKSWQLDDPKERERVYSLVAQWLADPETDPAASEFAVWLKRLRTGERRVDFRVPGLAEVLARAASSGALNSLPPSERDYLLAQCQPLVEEVAAARVPGHDPVPALVELAAAAHRGHATPASRDELARWRKLLRFSPRSLGTLTDEEFVSAPLCGIGSASGVVVTIYRDAGNSPVRLDYAGVTPDAQTNEQVFGALYATGLASWDDNVLVLTQGGSVAPVANEQVLSRPDETRVISAVLGPGGLVDPKPGLAHVGMGSQEALDLTVEVLTRTQTATGLVTVTECGEFEARALEEKIRALLGQRGQGQQTLRASHLSGASSMAIRRLPWYHRDELGKVAPIEIAIPTRALGIGKLHRLLTTARKAQLMQLIENCKRREVMARSAHDRASAMVDHWKKMSAEAKAKLCEQSPFVEITIVYDFELGLQRRLSKPDLVPRLVYEENNRPAFCRVAARYIERFRLMGEHLKNINEAGGKADRATAKLLVDCLVRSAEMPIPDPEFQAAFAEWAEIGSTPIRAAVERWALSRGMDPSLLGQANVIFDSHFDQEEDAVVLHPCLLVDVHQHEIVIDAALGVMWANPISGPTLAQSLVPAPECGVNDVISLRTAMAKWTTEVFGRHAKIADSRAEVEKLVADQAAVGAIVAFRRARQMVLSGHYAEAMLRLEEIRRHDLGPIYFWGAVCSQCDFLQTNVAGPLLLGVPRSRIPEYLLNMAISILLDNARLARGLETGRVPPLCEQARQFWAQLEARDHEFVEGLLAKNPDVPQLEKASLNLSPEDERRLSACSSAIQAMDLLAFAEVMRKQASGLPLVKTYTGKVSQVVAPILAQMNALPFGPPEQETEIRELCALVSAGGPA